MAVVSSCRIYNILRPVLAISQKKPIQNDETPMFISGRLEKKLMTCNTL